MLRQDGLELIYILMMEKMNSWPAWLSRSSSVTTQSDTLHPSKVWLPIHVCSKGGWQGSCSTVLRFTLLFSKMAVQGEILPVLHIDSKWNIFLLLKCVSHTREIDSSNPVFWGVLKDHCFFSRQVFSLMQEPSFMLDIWAGLQCTAALQTTRAKSTGLGS